MARRSGTEKRQRSIILTARFDQKEAAAVRKMANSSGISVGSLLRRALFNTPPPRAARRPTVEVQAVARLLGQLGKIGSNINQIAYHLNAGRPGDRVEGSLEEALRDLSELRIVCLQALGLEPHRGFEDDHHPEEEEDD
jgi:hypothetical protein